MRTLFITSLVISGLVGTGYQAVTFWQQSINQAVASALASQQLKHKREIAKVKAKARAKAKVQRAISAVPFVGVVAFGTFEALEYKEWKQDNPNGTLAQYTQETTNEIEALFDEEYREYKAEYLKNIGIFRF